jgi:cytoskeletal protein RodZ
MKLAHLLVIGSVFLLPLGAQAQWQWIDKDNKKVFSDQPPPIDIPEKNILRRPSTAKRLNFSTPAAEGAAKDAPASPAPTTAAAKPSGVDKELEEKARKAEEAEKAKQAAEAQKAAQAKADNCKRAREGKATMDSGIRLARVNAQGEREIMDDDARAAEQKRLQTMIDSDCK